MHHALLGFTCPPLEKDYRDTHGAGLTTPSFPLPSTYSSSSGCPQTSHMACPTPSQPGGYPWTGGFLYVGVREAPLPVTASHVRDSRMGAWCAVMAVLLWRWERVNRTSCCLAIEDDLRV